MLYAHSRFIYIASVAMGLAAFGCGGEEETPDETIRRIPLIGDQTYPEGVAVHQVTKEVFVSAPNQGQIQRVVDGKAEVFVDATTNPELLEAFAGLTVDEPRNRLLACNAGDFTTTPRSQLAVFDTTDGSLIGVVPVPTDDGIPHLLNDVTVDAAGNIYVTDMTANQIWRVPSDLSGIAVFAPSTAFAPPTVNEFGIIGLNGIAVAPSGTELVTSMTFEPHLYSIDLASAEVSELEIQGGYPAMGADGMAFANDTTLLVLQNTGNTIYTVELDTGSRSGRLLSSTAPEPVQALLRGPTTGEILDGTLYLANGQFDRMATQDPVLPFELLAVPLSLFSLD